MGLVSIYGFMILMEMESLVQGTSPSLMSLGIRLYLMMVTLIMKCKNSFALTEKDVHLLLKNISK